MRAKHTPGPWTNQFAEEGHLAVLTADGQTLVALIDHRDDEQEEVANGMLVAAAPDLLEALKAMHKAFNAKLPIPSNLGDKLEAMCVAALAKAERA